MRIKNNSSNHLDDDNAELEYLEKQLGRMDALSGKLVNILDGFDGRLMKLETSILPIHRATQNLTRLANSMFDNLMCTHRLTQSAQDIDATLKVTENIVDCLNLPSKEETFILKGPEENNVLPYLQAMGRLKDAVDTVEKSQLSSCDKAVGQMKQLLKAGMLHLETLFRKWLSVVSNPIDSNAMLNSDRNLAPAASLRQLSQLSTYITTSESEIGYSVDFTKPYIEIRSAYLSKSLHTLSQSVQLSEKHQGTSYEKGSSEFLKYMECLFKMIKSEHEFAERILKNPSRRSTALKSTIAPALSEFISAGRQLNVVAKRLNYSDTTFIFDILEKYEKEYAVLLDGLAQEIDLSEITEMINAFKLTALKNFNEFMEDLKGKRENNAYLNLSSDGTVHEMTSNTLNYMKRLYLWRDTVEPLLMIVGDAGWNSLTPITRIPEQRSSYYDPAEGAALLQRFFVEALDQMTISLQSKSRGYRKAVLATVFLLNNYNHTLRQIRSPPLNAIFDESVEMNFSKLVKKQLDAYQESWKTCVENLMDSFNAEFEEIWRAQTTYAIPDAELRSQVIRNVKNVIVPMYGRFLDKYQGTDFTKNPAKYIKYDIEKLDKMIGQLFEPTA
ncbi:exocyst complex component exo70 [Apophysomyces ossiformis]|uniref:Exocyst complex protein EXO70 n=1 Tax=Apophysomyces ossiformis TaxID=679940 RepID=A0A8H7EUD4_9FUNG|nr:exocyst complex component exo70 [Apophysomyces ossiformis]